MHYTPNPPNNIVDFTGLDSSIILIRRGGILISIAKFLESWSQAVLIGTMLVGRLDVPGRLTRRQRVRYPRPTHAVRIQAVKNPRSRNAWASLCKGESHPSRIRICSGPTPESPDSYFVSRAQEIEALRRGQGPTSAPA